MSAVHLEPLNNGVLDQCQQDGINPMFWSCLGGGGLINSESEQAVRIRAALEKVASEHNVNNIEQIAYSWLLTLPCAGLPILGSSSIERIKIAVAATDIKLSREQWYRV